MATQEPSRKTPFKGQTSKYFGVYKARGQEGAYVVHFHDKEKARSVYLGTFGDEEEAARAHDIATLMCSGNKGKFNFPISEYRETLGLMKNFTTQQVVENIRRSSSHFAVDYRGVGRMRGTGRWMAFNEVRNPGIFLRSFETKEEAAMAYDVEAIKIGGWNAFTNFDIKLYNVEAILTASASLIDAEDRAKFIKKELLDKTKKYSRGKQFLDQLGHRLRGETTGAGETSNSIALQPLNSGYSQFSLPAKVEQREMRNEMPVEKNPEGLPSNHFAAGAGSKFRHSSSSCFKPYKRARLMG